MKKKKVLLAMSGGVDSSVAAYLLQSKGYHVVGMTMCMNIIPVEGQSEGCCGPEGIRDARKVCDTLGIAHHVFDFGQVMRDKVITPFIDEYARGRTPNPCVWCNQYVKFDRLLAKAIGLGFDYLATGHYVSLRSEDDSFFMYRPEDRKKDQTYFLHAIKKDALENLLFPLGDLTKDEVRRYARDGGLHISEKKESQDICFTADKDYRTYMDAHAEKPGNILSRDGRILGKHSGISHYTIGQRKGLGIAAPNPLYVVRIDVAENTIVVGEKQDILGSSLIAGNQNWFTSSVPARACAQIRYAHTAAECTIEQLDNEQLKVCFLSPQESITPGQSIVFYDGDKLLGGAIIEKQCDYPET